MTIQDDAYRYAIRNAFSHKGKADAGALIGKLKALYPDANVKDLVGPSKEAVEKVNGMSPEEIAAEYEKFEQEGFELKIPDKKVGLEDLDWASNEHVVTRYAPNPSAPGHLGHLRPAVLSYLYAKKYNGKFILRFDDTDPRLKKPLEGGEKLYLDDLAWFGIVPDEVTRSSDRFDLYYDYMRQLTGMGHTYVCMCDVEKWRALVGKKKACPCREMSTEEQAARLEKMLSHEYKQGEAVLRLKTDVTHEDPSQRDWPLARIVDKPQHYRVKDKFVWPVYNFASAIDDHLMGVSLIIRGQEHYQNMLKQKWLYEHFGWTYPHTFHHGRMLMKGAELSKSKMIAGIESGKYKGWDDPRLFTIQSLRRKGFTPDGIRALILDLGLKTGDTNLDLQLLGTFNRPFVENSPVIPFIENPVQLSVDFAQAMEVEMDGTQYSLKQGTQSFLIPRESVKGKGLNDTFRLRGAYIVKLNHVEDFKLNAQFISTQKLEKTTQVPWIIEGADVQIIMPDADSVFGVTGVEILDLQEGAEVFFPNFGFCRIDAKRNGKVELWFTHQ